ncbi:hypothetical protein EVG20_g467 [Dentipellis fragilis]|uniref:F-box domain-containing protein n=1 Tax=Dentipellis fragilis TaxID=205917 RepID=A0A4Y9ZFJ8_9AGAM|nr:hypothetical protein EVG20_g467 [Dentipellis fragilis]
MIFDLELNNSLTENNEDIPRSAALSHVCSRWRAVCLGDHRLWTTISLDITGRWRSEFAARSGNLPLDVSVHLRPIQGGIDIGKDIGAQMVMQHIHHIRCLEFQGRVDELRPFASSLVKKAAPKLETLHIYYTVPETTYDAVRQYRIPVDIFANTAPHLHSLKLAWVRLPHSLPPAFENLKEIETESSLSALDVWKLLPSTTYIRTLRFTMVDSLQTDISFSRTTPVNAPELTTFVVYDISVDKLVQMLSNFLVAPSLSQIALCNIRVPDFLMIYAFARALSRHLPPHIETLRRKHGPLHEVVIDPDRVICWPTHLDTVAHRGSNFSSPFNISWCSDNVFGYERLTSCLVGMLPVDEIHTLHVSDRGYHPAMLDELWIRLYSASNVTVLNFAVEEIDSTLFLLQALMPLRYRTNRAWWLIGPPMPDDTLFPKLEKLVFVAAEMDLHNKLFLLLLSRLVMARRMGGKHLEFAYKKDHWSPEALFEVKLEDDALGESRFRGFGSSGLEKQI